MCVVARSPPSTSDPLAICYKERRERRPPKEAAEAAARHGAPRRDGYGARVPRADGLAAVARGRH